MGEKVIIPEGDYFMVLTAEVDAKGPQVEEAIASLQTQRKAVVERLEALTAETFDSDYIKLVNMFTWVNFCIIGLEGRKARPVKPKAPKVKKSK